MPGPPAPAHLAELRRTGRTLHLRLLTADGAEHVQVPVPQATAAALGHLWAAPATGADLLLAAVGAAGGRVGALVVRGGDDPGFRLQVQARGGPAREVELDVLDAAVLLRSGRVPLALERVEAAIGWDSALRTLLEDR